MRRQLSAVRASVFFFNDTATTEIYTLSLHDALPIWISMARLATTSLTFMFVEVPEPVWKISTAKCASSLPRSEEHTSELQSRLHLVCRLLLEKKNRPIFTSGIASNAVSSNTADSLVL